MNEAWRALKVGDRIQIVQLPTEFSLPGFVVAAGTIDLYQHLIAVAAILEVYEIDECGIPWIEYRSPQTTGHVNFLALCDDSRLLVP